MSCKIDKKKEFNLDQFYRDYETEQIPIVINKKKFNFLIPKTIDRFINKDNLFNEFPLWAKIWEATSIMAAHMADLPPEPSKIFLEIGAGIGVAGIVAACFGHRIVISEYNPDALNFAKANALINNCHNLKIKYLDWNKPLCNDSFDQIIGSEVIYKKRDIKNLLNLFNKYLKPGGEILLAEGIRTTGLIFKEEMERYFYIKVKKTTLRTNDSSKQFLLFQMKSRIS
ncbi:MAG TPA: methyltransferase [Desulfobacteraceae bacterium]|nr:methyltransferase [Desulfobacteraceae bacterium]